MTPQTVSRPWLVLFGLALSVSISNGFGRFAYGLILPAMKESLHWNYSQAGWLNTANALGYVAGSVLTMMLIRRVSPSRLFAFGTVATSASLLATGLDEALVSQTIFRMAAGVFGALSYVSGGTLAASMFQDSPRKNALAIAFYFGIGGGLGIVICGATIPLMLDIFGEQSWDWAWYGVGFLSLAFCPLSVWAARGLRQHSPDAAGRSSPPIGKMLSLIASYGLFGLGYIVYLTFLSVWMKEQHASVALTAFTWIALGLGIMVSTFVWRGVFARFASGLPMALVLICVAVGTALPIFLAGSFGLILSATIFGLSVFMPPGAVTNFVRQNLSQQDWGTAFSYFTITFAVAQTLGPIGAGLIGDRTGNIGDSLLTAAGVLVIGAVFAILQKSLTTQK